MNAGNGGVSAGAPGRRAFRAALLLKLPVHLWYFIRCVFLFRNPLSFCYCYVRGTAPADKKIALRKGWEIHLSDHPHDVRTVFVVFVKKDYGKISRNAVVLDLGSNIGVFALYAAYCGARRIYSFEPNQRNYDALMRNIKGNGLENVIVPFKQAVSAVANQQVRFSLSSGPYNRILKGESGSDGYELVDTTSLDAIMAGQPMEPVDLLKADCEGAEYDILLHTNASSFSRIKTIRIEFHRWPVESLIAHLRQHGFHCVHLDRENAVMWLEKGSA